MISTEYCIAYSSHGHMPIVIVFFQLVSHTFTNARTHRLDDEKKNIIAFVNVMKLSIRVQQLLSAEAKHKQTDV